MRFTTDNPLHGGQKIPGKEASPGGSSGGLLLPRQRDLVPYTMEMILLVHSAVLYSVRTCHC
ncbi:MAG: hypothetical protein Ct9H300mP28_08510 [Pseudomonadota bacterium]|nr:MAG: hypothetical protein Ct9H300mP28_08510 [Pseudomonadota bacterium]